MLVADHRADHSRGGFGPALVLLCVGAAMLEGILVGLLAPSSALALAPQVSAPAPIDVFHDLRWVAVYHDSWVSFGGELAGLLVFRTVLDTAIVRLAWPAGVPRVPLKKALLSTAGFTAVAVVGLMPWTIVLFGTAVTPISWLFLVAIPPVVIMASLNAHGAVNRTWWRQLPPLAPVVWILASFVVLSAAAAAIRTSPLALGVALVGLTGAWNAWAWSRVVAGVLGVRRARPAPLVAPLASLAMVGIALGGAALGFGGGTAVADRSTPAPAVAPRPVGPAVLVVAGFGTSWNGTTRAPALGGYSTRWFSYRGASSDGAPLPYGPSDTQESLPSLDQKMATQVTALSAQTGLPVRIVAVSEGTLVAKTYVADTAGAPVDQLVLVSPLVNPGRVYYPVGQVGWGLASGWGLRLLTDSLPAVSTIHVSPTTPLFRSIVSEGPSLRSVLDRPLPGVRQTTILPLADAVAGPDDLRGPGPGIVVAAFHSGALTDAGIRTKVSAALDGRRSASPPWSTTETIVRRASSAWQVPTLLTSLNPAWSMGQRPQ